MKLKKITKQTIFGIVTILFVTIFGCKKDFTTKPSSQNKAMSTMSAEAPRVNPYDVRNIKVALTTLGRDTNLLQSRIYYYYKFNPQKVNGTILRELEKDTTIMISAIPFADGNLYSMDNPTLSMPDTNVQSDDKLYIVFNSGSQVKSIFESQGASIDAVELAKLYLPKADDKDLQLQAIISAGLTQDTSLTAFRFHWPCLFKQPHGRVTYKDAMNGNTIGVPQIQVWALVFGIPVSTYTNDQGYYYIPWAFSVGTFIGTHAKNWRANVKPLNTTGGILANIAQLTVNFIAGSIYWDGWHTSCDMKSPINIHFGSHTQARYWAQTLHIVKLHHDYAAQDGIMAAPNHLAIYAQWADGGGNASTPMLGHIQTNPISLFTNLVGVLFNTNLSVNSPNFFNLLTGLLPDVTVRVSNNIYDYYDWSYTPAHNFFSESLAETEFHELAHASLYRKVGQTFWIGVITNIIAASGSSCGGYGCGTETFAGLTQVNEAWAEFIGKEYHKRFHPNGKNWVTYLDPIQNYYHNDWYGYPEALEDVPWFVNDWINTGIFYDLMDPANEPYDVLQGFSIQNMYNCFTSATDGFCFWRETFLQNNPNVNSSDLDNLMKLQNKWNGNCNGDWIPPVFNGPVLTH